MTELTSLKGIGPKTAEALSRLGISDTEDLIFFYPRDYETYAAPKALFQLESGKTETVRGVLQKEASLNYFKGMRIVNAYLSDMTGRLQLSWYNLPYIRQQLRPGVSYVFRGRVYEKNGRMIMYQPRVYREEEYEKQLAGRLLPVYPLTEGVTNALLRKCIKEALKAAEDGQKNASEGGAFSEFLPDALREKQGLWPLSRALFSIHFPASEEALLSARRRLCFDEFLLFLLGIAVLRRQNEKRISDYRCRPDFRLLKFIADLPFSLTEGQQRAFREISADLGSGRVMNRLLEGDVGSGKTIVALLSMLLSALNGFQAVLMAPTEVLAAQHYETIRGFLQDSGLPVSAELLTGSMSQAQKEKACARIRSHEANLIIGTHAVFQEQVVYDRLGLVVTDEQHRFGVGQRARLSEKGGAPHVLVMSATPIPRTLAAILYSELDISILEARPAGRKAIKNCVVGPGYRRTAYQFILGELKKGRQAYVICPMIEAEAADGEEGAEKGAAGLSALSGEAALQNVKDYAEKLRRLYPAEIRIGVLHGRMKGEEKEAAMRAFLNKETDLLVSTTVIEVGVDVPNASVIMIENAERFGLAQLHQLRGRVGRGAHQSYCIMINTSESEAAAERLSVLNGSNDGFFIANEDLRLRGPGDLFGIRQSGELRFRLADIYSDKETLALAKKVSDQILSEDPALSAKEHRALSERLSRYMEKTRGNAL